MVETKGLIKIIIEGMENLKAKKVVEIDLRKIDSAICDYFIICEGDSNVQVNAIAQSVEKLVREVAKEKPISTIGYENSEWIAMDYMHVIVHVFQRSAREFYDLEHLWSDAKIKNIKTIND